MKLVFFNLGDYANIIAAAVSGGLYGNIHLEDTTHPSFSTGAAADAYTVATQVIEMMGGWQHRYAFVLLSDDGKVLDQIN